MTEKLFTGTLNHNQNKTKTKIFKQGCITEAYIFFLLNFDLKHRIVGTHIRNNPLHCSQLLSELLVFELNFVNIGLCLFDCAMKVLIQLEM